MVALTNSQPSVVMFTQEVDDLSFLRVVLVFHDEHHECEEGLYIIFRLRYIRGFLGAPVLASAELLI